MSLENCGEWVPIEVFAPDDFDASTGFLRLRPAHVSSFMALMMARKTAAFAIDERTALRVAMQADLFSGRFSGHFSGPFSGLFRAHF